jgi:hypothetical protein
MNARHSKRIAAMLGSLVLVALAVAEPGIPWYTVDGGGAMLSQGGTFTVSGTIGQADPARMTGGTFTLNGGFWSAGTQAAPCTPPSWSPEGFAAWSQCLSGPGPGDPVQTCSCSDLDGDGDVDLADFGKLQVLFTTGK